MATQMTEKEKAAEGLLYDANNDPELLAEMAAGAEKCFVLNSLPPSKAEERKEAIRNLLGRTGEKFEIRSPFFCDYGYNIEIGENFFMNMNCVILDGAKVTFGDNVFVAPGCGFYTAGHTLDAEQRNCPPHQGRQQRMDWRQCLRAPRRDHRRQFCHRSRQRGHQGHPVRRGRRRKPLPGHTPDRRMKKKINEEK